MVDIKGLLSNPIQAYQSAREPGGLLAPVTSYREAVTDPRLFIADALINRTPITTALTNYAAINQSLAPEETERDIRIINNQAVDLTDPQNPQVLGDYGTSLTGSANQTTDYKNYLNIDPTPTPEEFGIFLDRNQSQTDTTTNYKDYLKTVPVGEDPSPTGFSKYLADKATAGATRIDLSEKAEAQIGVEFAKTQLKEVGKDLEKTGNWLAESQAISKMSEGLENFQTGALGNVRASVGSIISLLNPAYQEDPEKLSKLFNPTGSQLTESGAAVYQRELARGLQNLNLEEVKINKRITTDTTKEPYVNKIILETLKIDNNAKRQLDEAANNFLAQNLTYKDYIALKKEIKNTATKQANDVYDTVTSVAKEIPKILKQELGASVQAFDVNNQVVLIKVQATDKFTGQSDMNGNPLVKTINGELYSLVIKPTADED